jgi:nucleoside-diphosphate-sugar epimerase
MRCSRKTANIQWGAILPRKRDTRIAIADTKTVFDEIGWKATIDLETGIKMYLKDYESTHA